MSGRYRAVLFDLFGTLIRFDATVLPEMTVDGRRVPSTLPLWQSVIEDVVPDVGVERFAAAVAAVSRELAHERATTAIEQPSRERFRRALLHAGCDEDRALEVAPLCARAHMRAIADATRFPAEHAAFLDEIAGHAKIAVITNFDDTAAAYEILRRHGILQRAGTIVVSEAVGLRKPHPALIHIALRDLDTRPADAVMIGDHVYEDVGAATAANVDSIWINPNEGPAAQDAPTPRHVITRLTDARPLLLD